MQIETTRCHYTPIKMAKIWNTDNTKCWWGCEATGTLLHCSWECKIVQPLWKTVGQVLTNLYYSAIMLLGLYPNELKRYTNVYSSFIHNRQNLEATKMSFSRWMDKLWYIQTMEYYSVIKRSELANLEKTWRNLKCMLLSERSRSEKATYYMVPTLWHSGKGKTIETAKRSVVVRGWEGGEDE